MGMRWYVASVDPDAATAIEYAIRALGYETYLPLVEQRHRSGITVQPFFPGYCFVRFDVDRQDWGEIRRRTPGVRLILTMDRVRPSPVRDRVVEALMESADERRVVWTDPRPFLHSVGVPLRVLRGPFLDHVGRCVWSKPDRVALLMDLLGGPREVVVPARDVVRA